MKTKEEYLKEYNDIQEELKKFDEENKAVFDKRNELIKARDNAYNILSLRPWNYGKYFCYSRNLGCGRNVTFYFKIKGTDMNNPTLTLCEELIKFFNKEGETIYEKNYYRKNGILSSIYGYSSLKEIDKSIFDEKKKCVPNLDNLN